MSTAAYGALRLCDASLAEWSRATSSLMASLCSFDPHQRRAALEALPYFPTELMVDYDRPHNQLWIGGIAGEPDDVHLAAVRCMDRILFREDFVCGLPKLLYESWNFVVDRVLDVHEPRAFWQPALCLLTKLFQRVFGPADATDVTDTADAVDEDEHYFAPDEMRAALTQVAQHVWHALAPHAGTVAGALERLPDRDLAPCLLGATTLLVLNALADGAGDARERLKAFADSTLLRACRSLDTACCAAGVRALLRAAAVVPQPHYGVAALEAVCVLARAAAAPRDVRDALALLVELLPATTEAQALAALPVAVETAAKLPARKERVACLVRACRAAVLEGARPVAHEEPLKQFLAAVPFAEDKKDKDKDKDKTGNADELLVALVTVFGEVLDARTEEGAALCVVLLEATHACLAHAGCDRECAVDAWLRWAFRLLRVLADLSSSSSSSSSLSSSSSATAAVKALRGRADAVLAAIVPRVADVASDALAVEAVYLLATFLPYGAATTEADAQPLLAVLRRRFLRLDELDAHTAAADRAHFAGALAFADTHPRPEPVQLRGALAALVVLAARAPRLAAPVGALLSRLSFVYQLEPRTVAEANATRTARSAVLTARLRVLGFGARTPSAAAARAAAAAPTHMLVVPEPAAVWDDAYYLGVASAALAASAMAPQGPSAAVLVSGESDAYAVRMAHQLDAARRTVTVFVVVTNVTALPQLGGTLTLEPSASLRPAHAPRGRTLTQALLRTAPYASRRMRFELALTCFAPTAVCARLSLALPKPGTAATAGDSTTTTGRTSSVARTQSRVAMPAISSTGATSGAAAAAAAAAAQSPAASGRRGSGGGTASLRQKAAGVTAAGAAGADADADGRAEAAALWPDVYTEPHVVAPFELVRPHAVPAPAFDACWAGCDTTARHCFALAARGGAALDEAAWTRARTALLAHTPARLHVHEVARHAWAHGTHVHAAYAFASWFDDVFAMHVFGRHSSSTTGSSSSGTARVCVELRCTRSCALRGFTAVALQRALFADIDDDIDVSVVSDDSP